jgi:uncharacterized membrane protein
MLSAKVLPPGIAFLLLFTCGLPENLPAAILHGIGSTEASGALFLSSDGSTVAGYNRSLFDRQSPWRWTASSGLELISFPPPADVSRPVTAMSGNGRVLYGVEPGPYYWMWDSVNGLQEQPVPGALGASFDGSVLVGAKPGATGGPFRWSASTGVVTLPVLPTAPVGFEIGQANAVSADGRLTVGISIHNQLGGTAPVLWKEDGQIVNLGTLAQSTSFPGGSARSISGDGHTVVGSSGHTGLDSQNAFRWTEESGMLPLGWFPAIDPEPNFGSASSAQDVSFIGDVIVGHAGGHAFVWTPDAGMQRVQSILAKYDGLDLSDWRLATANSISDDGTTIAGTGIYQGVERAWVATREEGWAVVVPEPTAGLFLTGCIPLLFSFRRQRQIHR